MATRKFRLEESMPGRLPARLTDAAAFLHESGNGGNRPAECADGEKAGVS